MHLEKTSERLSSLEFLSEYGLFLAKAVTIVVAIFVVVMFIVGMGLKSRRVDKGHIEVRNINENLKMVKDMLRHTVIKPETMKKLLKDEKKQEKTKRKELKKKLKKEEPVSDRSRVYVIDFVGDVQASAVTQLRQEVTAILAIATSQDEVVVRLESSGGAVHGYGLASSQLMRIPGKDIRLTVAVDKVAASGGYMMACIANKIIAAPFAILGSIGVMTQVPNFHKLLKKHEIDFEVLTAGEYKRTLSLFGENTDKAREKVKEELEDVHSLFKDFVAEHRPAVDVEEVATGEYWHGKRAIEKNLVDELMTSDEYLLDRCEECDVFHVAYLEHKSRVDKFLERVSLGFSQGILDLLFELNRRKSLFK